MMKGMSDAECVRACIKSGANWALLSDGKIYLLEGGDKTKLNDLAGKRVTLTGEVSGTNIAVKQLAAAK
jgi:FlaA1/EpsC-like NDP-sugar epimerase